MHFFLVWMMENIIMHNNGSHSNKLNQMFWLLLDTKLQGLENAKSSKDS
jgi:hypothetical protein